jgi:hypothetical protein
VPRPWPGPGTSLWPVPSVVVVPALFLGPVPSVVVVPALFLGPVPSVVVVPALFLGPVPSVVVVPELVLEEQRGAHHHARWRTGGEAGRANPRAAPG